MSTSKTNAPRAAESGHVLQGSLAAEDVRVLYEHCATVKFTGLLELSEAARRLTITFVGGEPLDGPDRFRLGAVWRRGSYRLVQRVLDLTGSLADGVFFEGVLGDVAPAELLHHCEEYRLSADVVMTGAGGRRATARFGKGRMESAEIDGRSGMDRAALEEAGAWPDGAFRVMVHPLFDGSMPLPTAVPAEVQGGVLDVTSRMPTWDVDELEDETPLPPAMPGTMSPASTASLASKELDFGDPDAPAPVPSDATVVSRPPVMRPQPMATKPEVPALLKNAPRPERPVVGRLAPPLRGACAEARRCTIVRTRGSVMGDGLRAVSRGWSFSL